MAQFLQDDDLSKRCNWETFAFRLKFEHLERFEVLVTPSLVTFLLLLGVLEDFLGTLRVLMSGSRVSEIVVGLRKGFVDFSICALADKLCAFVAW